MILLKGTLISSILSSQHAAASELIKLIFFTGISAATYCPVVLCGKIEVATQHSFGDLLVNKWGFHRHSPEKEKRGKGCGLSVCGNIISPTGSYQLGAHQVKDEDDTIIIWSLCVRASHSCLTFLNWLSLHGRMDMDGSWHESCKEKDIVATRCWAYE